MEARPTRTAEEKRVILKEEVIQTVGFYAILEGHKQMSDLESLVLQALRMNEFDRLLKGNGPYAVSFGYETPGDGPTNWLDLVTKGIYPAHINHPSHEISRHLLITLEGICEDELGAYSALYLIYIQLLKERDGAAPFHRTWRNC